MSLAAVTLSQEQLEQLADLIAARLRRSDQRSAKRLVTAAELAAELGVARGFVYRHADELGAVRLADSEKAPLRFDVEAAKTAMARSLGGRSHATIASVDGGSETPARSRRRRLPDRLPQPGSVLAVRAEPTVSIRAEEAA